MTLFNKHNKFSPSSKILGREKFAKRENRVFDNVEEPFAQGSKIVEMLKRGLLAIFLVVVFSQHRVLK